MFKKILMYSLLMAAGFSVANSQAITIINQNNNTVSYIIADTVTCSALEYNKGQISTGGQIVWIKGLIYHPDSVCVRASGLTSTIGAFSGSVNNDNCVLVVKDAGFMRGVKIEKQAGC